MTANDRAVARRLPPPGHDQGPAAAPGEPGAPVRVLLVEDHASYRQALEIVMAQSADLEVVAQVERADQAGPAAAEHRPDVAIVDLDLAGGSGIDALADIRRAAPDTTTVVLSALTDDVEFGRAIEGGAAAVLHKSIDIPDLLGILRRVAAGAVILPAEDTSRRLQALALQRGQEWHARLLAEQLTDRERQVLQGLANGRDHRAIAREFGISPETVQTHIRNLHAKMGVGSRLEAVVKAIRMGLVEPPR